MTKSEKARRARERRRRALDEYLVQEYGDGVVRLDGPEFDGGIVGVTADGRLVYSYGKLVEALMEANGWDSVTAAEWIDFNTVRSLPYMGDGAPIVMHDLDVEDFSA